MARPIEGIPIFTGKAAKWLTDYLKTARPSPAKAELARKDREIAERIRLLER